MPRELADEEKAMPWGRSAFFSFLFSLVLVAVLAGGPEPWVVGISIFGLVVFLGGTAVFLWMRMKSKL